MTPIDYKKYPVDWSAIVAMIKVRAGDACEWCGAANHKRHPETGSTVVLTVAHVDQNIKNNDHDNLRALCQRCHLEHDHAHHVHKRKYGRDPNQRKLPI